MKQIFLIVILFLVQLHAAAEEYKSAQKFSDGDVVSAEVLNDILDRIELSIKTISTDELVGSWKVEWKTCISGGPGNCSSLNAGEGWDTPVDNLYRTRDDTWVIRDDGDGTYSVGIENYCFLGASGGVYYNDPCEMRIHVDSSVALFGTISGIGVTESSDFSAFMEIKRVSPTRFFLWKLASGSNSFLILKLDKIDIPPPSTTNLSADVSNDSVTLAWDDLQDASVNYSVTRKTRGKTNNTFSELALTSESTYTDDDITSGNTYLYRVYAKNSHGTGVGSNVVSVRYVTVNAPAGPTELSAVASDSFIYLDWEAGDDLATSYSIQRRIGSDGDFSEIGTTSTTTSFTDISVSAGVTYTYVVYANNESGNSLPSSEVTITFDPTDSSVVSGASGWFGSE